MQYLKQLYEVAITKNGESFQFVYTDADGYSYIPTPSGAKKISTNNEAFLTGDYLVFDF